MSEPTRTTPPTDVASPAPGREFLAIIGEAGESWRAPLDRARLLIGRTSTADVTLPSPRVSREHAELIRDPFGRWWLRDRKSRNGVTVNGIAVAERVIQPGDRIVIGPFTLTLVVPGRAARAASPPQGAAVRMSEAETTRISRLDEGPPARIDMAHLAALRAFGDQLPGIADPAERMAELCRLMVRAEFHGLSAMTLRIDRAAEGAPLRLIPAALAPLHDVEPYVSRSLLGAVRATLSPALAGSARIDPGAIEISISPDAGPPVAAAAAPIAIADDAVDLLYVTLPAELGTAEWLAVVALAAQEYQRAESTLAVRERERAAALIEQELAQARDIQMRLVPAAPKLPGLQIAVGFEPCRWVGGDYVDVAVDDAGRALLVMADVSGKGLPAALVASELHAMVRASLGAGADLLGMMTTLNRYLCRYLRDGMFATMVALLVDPVDGCVTSVNAGHPPPVVVAEDGATRFIETITNLPLGVMDEPMQASTDRLDPGSVIALYTDGLTEMRRDDGAMLKMSGLAEELARVVADVRDGSVEAVSAALSSRLDAIQGDRMPEDDRTFLVARRSS